ncbi:MAG: diaminopimelate epimerase [Elusimicrobia bacterium]|nr:diaminopimelate epimerase [Elusimicrobiota bacterium]
MRLSFDKLSGAGNDFVMIEAHASAKHSALARRLCDRRSGVGADGLLVVSRRPSLRLAYFNADGSEAFCGNGSRCAAWWMFRRGWTDGRREFEFATSEGVLRSKVLGARTAAIRMPRPRVLRLGIKIKIGGRSHVAHWLDTGVPHAVVVVKRLDFFPVVEVGRALRFHKAFGRTGANVDFVAFGSRGLSVRTYERGVEDETLACGTGVVASALTASLLGKARSPVRVKVRSGQTLRVQFRREGRRFEDLWLEGPAQLVFSGEI